MVTVVNMQSRHAIHNFPGIKSNNEINNPLAPDFYLTDVVTVLA
jgi:hypothetical protein